MRVVHSIGGRPDPASLNGVARAVYFLTEALARLDLDVGLLAFDSNPPAPAADVTSCTVPRSRWPVRLASAIRQELSVRPPDILHLHSPYFPGHIPLARWALRHSVPYVVTPHGALSPGEMAHRRAFKLPYKYLFELPILNRAAFVHSLGPCERLEQYGVRSPIVLVPNGVTVDAPSRDVRPLRELYPELAGRRVFLFIGRLDPLQKGLDLLIEAFVRAQPDHAALVMVGPDWRGCRRRIARRMAHARSSTPMLLLEERLGRAKLDMLAGADVFVHTSRWEGMSHAVLEAAALARPCLLTRAADPLGRLGEAEAAIVVEPDVPSIAEGIRRLSNMDAGALAEMGSRARRIAADFTWDRAAAALADAYVRYAGNSFTRRSVSVR